jgi:CelD/BcsL family acetyltransferase involved in cellulose biosynthesis
MLPVVPLTLEAEPACPPPLPAMPTSRGRSLLVTEYMSVDAIGCSTWDRLAERTRWATPFSTYAFARAWWDAYGETAHDETLVVHRDQAIVGIVPLMRRHFTEPGDMATATELRHGHEPALTALRPAAQVTYFGASYHADYATVLCDPDDLPGVAEAVAAAMATPAPGAARPEPADAIDLRRLRCSDPAVTALASAFEGRAIDRGWTVTLEREDVCPVVTLADGSDLDGYLSTLDKKDRHEIRRKVRRAEAAGDVRLVDATDLLAELPAFIDLHQRRWGEHGLFPDTEGGRRSRVLFRRLFEEFAGSGVLRLSFLWIGDRRVGAAVWFCQGDTAYYYNAGLDPAARELSPGVLLVERSVRRAIEEGTRRLDFLRGDEPYKYEWGARDEPIIRLLVRRADG